MENAASTKEFVVDTNAHCFLCLDKIFLDYCQSSILDDTGTENAASPSLQKYSMQYLSRYLEMDLTGSVFNDKGSIPSYLLSKVQRSHLTVTLCKNCAGWNATMLELCRQLEKIEMEVRSYLERMYGRLLGLVEKEKEADVFGKTSDPIGAGPKGKLEVVRRLRSELKQKCSSKLQDTSPRIKIQKLTSKEFLEAKLNSKCKSDGWYANQMTSSEPKESCEEWMELGMQSICAPFKVEIRDDNEPLLMSDVNDDTQEASHLSDMIWNEISTTLTEPPGSSGVKASASKIIHTPKVRKISSGTRRKFVPSSEYKCSICQKAFSSVKNCERHVLEVHSGVKFRCRLCRKLFNSKSSLYYHQRTSCELPAKQRPRPFRCPTCGKGFADGKVLKMHVRDVHLKSRERKCSVCGGTFSSPWNLKLHCKTMHFQIRDHGCDLCGMKFKRKDALQNHRRVKHIMIN